MTYNFSIRTFRQALLLTWNFAAYGQILQERPELCGKSEFVPIPGNVSATQDTLIVTTHGAKIGFKTNFLGKVEQVCQLSSNRYLIFIQASMGGSYQVFIVNGSTADLIDKFDAYDPSVSPDQHWIAYRDFFPRMSNASEEYLLYDLTKDASANRPLPTNRYIEGMKGKVAYPAVAKGRPFHHINLPEEQTHSSFSSFYWSSDSSALAFADMVQDILSIVLIPLDVSESKPLIHRITPEQVRNFDYFRHIEVNPESQVVQAEFLDTHTGQKKFLTLRWADFEPAKLEVHPEIVPTMETVIVPSKRKEN